MIIRFHLLALAGLLSLAACGQADAPPVAAETSTQRMVSEGAIIGYIDSDNSAQVWLGLSFAAAPQGDLRWRAPQEPVPHNGLFEALRHSAPCPQMTNALSAEGFGAEPGELIGSEDCLVLDIYAPPEAGPQNADRPVMVWIHGGSNIWGSGAQYDGAQLATDQNVVVVVVQYRLGPLGFFSHPALTDDAGMELDAAANFALLDQIAALEWVRGNIAEFGGDAGNVTIFGESAGGHNVVGLMASPLAEGLFHRAIIQSGSFSSVSLEDAQTGSSQAAVAAAERFAGADAKAEAIRNADLQAIYDAYTGDGPSYEMPRMIQDGVSLPLTPLAEAFASPETFNAVPVITGVTRDEMKLFNAFDPELTGRRFGVIIHSRDAGFYDRTADYQSRVWRVLAVDQPASLMQAGGHADVWAYRFDWDEAGSMLFMDFSHLLGAAHAMEIPFVFNNFEFFGRLDDPLFNARNAEGREALAGAMGAYWAAFARNGAPGDAGGPTWLRWEETGVLMRFDSPEAGGQEVLSGTDSLEQILTDLTRDANLDPTERCMVLARINYWIDEADLAPPFEC